MILDFVNNTIILFNFANNGTFKQYLLYTLKFQDVRVS